MKMNNPNIRKKLAETYPTPIILSMKLTKKQKDHVKRLQGINLARGEARSIYICQDKKCRQIQAHDFIPYGIGRGVWRNPCHCNAVDSNWIFRAKELKTITAS
jgi:hypothetical protein